MSASAELVLASSRQDAAAVETVRAHHAELAAGLATRAEGLLRAAERVDQEPADQGRTGAARTELLTFCRHELIPHARAEESTLYRAAAELPGLRLLIAAMTGQHGELLALVDEVDSARFTLRAAAAGRALVAAFGSHLALENDVVLPALAADPGVSLSGLLDRMREEFAAEHLASRAEAEGGTGAAPGGGALPGGSAEGAPAPAAATSRHGSCGCGEADEELPELDVRAVPHAIRHATVFGAFDSLRPGASLVLVAPHDPQPLLRQLAERSAGALSVDYLQRGPEAWRLKLTR